MQTESVQTGCKDYNTTTKLVVAIDVIQEYKQYEENRKIGALLKEFVHTAYTSGYGYKIISNTLDSSYTKIRGLCSKCIDASELRRGRSISTNVTKALRSARLKDSIEQPWKQDEYPRTSTGVSGFFYHENNRYYLRSTYEYVFIKFLILNRVSFKVEEHSYKLKDGRVYRPDFFIYDSSNKLQRIVELKGRVFNNNADKPVLLAEQLSIPVELITDIKPYCHDGDYNLELSNWKKYLTATNQTFTRKGIKK